jgi:nucleotide-binding universal stress UspA family protein
MNAIPSLLVHLDGSAACEPRLQLAHQLAKSHGAALSALFAVAPRFVPVPLPIKGAVPDGPLLDEIDPAHRRHAKSVYDRAVAGGAPASTWHELSGEPAIAGFVQRALLADLLVLGQRHPTDADGFDVPADFVEAVIIDSGRPAFVVPCAGHVDPAPKTVLIAWKPTREAARALSASLPFLRRAQRVHIVCASDDIVDLQTAIQVRHYLRLHGIATTDEHHIRDRGQTGVGLLELCAELQAGLLVMGCYGHSRARELMLGGATRSVLQSMTLPVLMAH